MEQFLTANNNKVDAVVSSNDGMAGGVVAALEAQGLAGSVPVSGQDGDKAALNRVALGTQTVSVWKDSRKLGKKAGEVAVALAKGTKMEELEGTVKFKGGTNGVEMSSYFLEPQAITKDNLNVVLDAKWITKSELCQGVKAGTAAACK
jgi:D-xylose transport system substrate-binding protein